MTIRSAEEAKDVLRLQNKYGRETLTDVTEAQAYLSALRGPEVTELVEAIKNYFKVGGIIATNEAKKEVQSALNAIIEARK